MIMAFHHNHETGRSVIGNKGDLPWLKTAPYAQEDLKRFKQLTTGKTVLMGAATFKSIGRPLPHRKNIVVTSRGDAIEGFENIEGIEIIKPIGFLDILQRSSDGEEIFIIGGESLYYFMNTHVEDAYITQIHPDNGKVTFGGDVFVDEWLDDYYYLNDEFAIVDTRMDKDSTFTHFKRKA